MHQNQKNDPLDEPPHWTQTHNHTDPCHRRQPEREKVSHIAAVSQADLQVACHGVVAMGFGPEEKRKRAEK